MNILPMQYYLEVVNEKSISRAAEKLHITQQALSGHMIALEKELGCTLFQRKPSFQLTYAGQVFLEYAGRFGQLYQSMQEEFGDIARNEQGEIVVGVSSMRGRFLITPVIPYFRDLFPKVRIRLVETLNINLLTLLLDDQADIVIGNIMQESPLLKVKHYYDENNILLVPRKFLAQNDAVQIKSGDYDPLRRCPFLMFGQKDYTDRVGAAFLKKHNILPQVAVVSKNMEALMDLCYKEIGACFCTREMADWLYRGKDRGHLLEIPLGSSYPIRFAWQNKPYVSKVLLEFVKICLAHK